MYTIKITASGGIRLCLRPTSNKSSVFLTKKTRMHKRVHSYCAKYKIGRDVHGFERTAKGVVCH